MDLNHLQLHVKDLERARKFYEAWFGFKERLKESDRIFLRNSKGFELALLLDRHHHALPEWFHFGFRLESPDPVRRLHTKMAEEGMPIRHSLTNAVDYVSFTCKDPDGYGIEIYWAQKKAAKHTKTHRGAHLKRRITDLME